MKTSVPFSWAGGKTRLLPIIKEYLPPVPQDYYEPFLGGGALFFDYGHTATGSVFLADICHPLINAYQHLQACLDEVLSGLTNLSDTPYDTIRSQFNFLKLKFQSTDGDWTDEDSLNLATTFIALNHLCFNGIYRENKKGKFNVPLGKNSKGIPNTLETLEIGKLVEASKKLSRPTCNVVNSSFSPWPFPFIPKKGDVYFADPPYLKEFSGYSKEGFTVDHHILLNAQSGAIAKKGATVIVCGSNNDASKEIYGEPTRIVELNRTVGNFKNSDKKRGKATEALWVWNPCKVNN